MINLCEVKFADGEFVIDKQYAQHLRRKLDVFRRVTQTRKSLFLTMVTSFGVRKNSYATDLVANEITMDDLFCSGNLLVYYVQGDLRTAPKIRHKET